jgi:hypothetical protein
MARLSSWFSTRSTAPEWKGVAELALQGDTDILAYRKMREDRRDLERAREAHARDRRRRTAGDVAALEADPAAVGSEVGQQVEAGRLAGTIGPDQA